MQNHPVRRLPLTSLVLLILAGGLASPAVAEIRFNRDIRPILSDHCFACHGPSAAESGLRLDQAESVTGEAASGARAVVPGDPDASELLRRIESDDEYEVMPPPEAQKPLSDEEKRLLREWIEAGATLEGHWAFAPPRQLEPSEGGDEQSPIDWFIEQRLEEAGLQPGPPAKKTRLARRVALDLTGLPPRREALQAFLDDDSPEAYEHYVDTLLADSRYGEHMARFWLDLVRYGDTHGLHLDNYREMWPYRDWVIKAFNENLSYAEFVKKQLAGDLLPDAQLDDLIASGFNRLNVTTNEGGSIYDEVFARNVIDRTEAFGTIFLGLTTGCAVCHDHKFDPLTMEDFYSLSAFFNSLDGRAMDGNIKDHPPVVRVPDNDHAARLAEFEAQLQSLVSEFNGPMPAIDSMQRDWEAHLTGGSTDPQWTTLRPEHISAAGGSTLELLPDGSVSLSGDNPQNETVTLEANLPEGAVWRLIQLEILPPAGAGGEDEPARVGRSANGNVVISEIRFKTQSPEMPNWLPISIAYAQADYEQPDGKYALSYALDDKLEGDAGWALGGHLETGPRSAWFVPSGLLSEEHGGKLQVEIVCESQWAQHVPARVRLSVADSMPILDEEEQIKLQPWHLTGPFPVENNQAAGYRKFASEGEAFKKDEVFKYRDKEYRWETQSDFASLIVNELPTVPDQTSVTVLHRNIVAPKAMKATLLVDTDDGFALYLNKEKIAADNQEKELSPLTHTYTVDLKKGNNSLLLKVINHNGPSQFAFAIRSLAAPIPESIRSVVSIPADQRSEPERALIRDYFRRVECIHPDLMALRAEIDGVVNQAKKLAEEIPTTLVWRETEQPRDAFVLIRGQYDQPGDKVARSTPEFLPAMNSELPNNRLGLANWLIDGSNPLTARVAVNRFWQQVFGIGIVETSEDFGAQGQPPSHPELLDWLAVDFMENGWDIKRLMKQLVMTEAYRRSGAASDSQLKIDPRNRLLAHGPRHRLDAEMLRDQALAVSGLLVEKLGGPSVKPPQPDGLWYAVGYTRSNTANFVADEGEKIYRRSVYTFWKRTSAPPTMTTFDAPSRESCRARRERTNTPLQALVLLNERQYFEAAKGLAQLTLKAEDADEERIAWAFRRVLCREPDDGERAELLDLLGAMRASYEKNADDAKAIAGENCDQCVELAAWTMVCNTLLNLDEAINK